MDPRSASGTASPAPADNQNSVFKSTAARSLGLFGLTAGAAWGSFAGVGSSIGNGSMFRNVVGMSISCSIILGTMGFFTGAGITAAGRTEPLQKAKESLRNFANKF